MRTAIVHDWLLGMRGGERCLEVLCLMFPEADLFTAFYDPKAVTPLISSRRVYAGKFNSLPAIKNYYRYLLPLYPLVADDLSRLLLKQHEESPYDLVISVSHCLAKNVAVPADVFHLCYCLTPMRYIWDQYNAYWSKSRLEPVMRLLAPRLRNWDSGCADRVDHFACISRFVADRIQKVYDRQATVLYPPVRTDWLVSREPDDVGEGFLCVNALVPYKNVNVIVEAFNELGYPLTIVGRGPEEKKLKALAKSNICFRSQLADEELAELYRKSQALVFAAEEDFGMVPIEMLAAGRPVICYGRGGALETVVSDEESPAAILFDELSPTAVARAVEEFTIRHREFTVDNCLEQSRKFSLIRFQREFGELLSKLGILDREERYTQPAGSRKIAAC